MKESQELFSGLGTGSHTSQHAASSCSATSLLHTAHNHAKMRRFHDDTDTTRLQDFGDSKSHLFSQALLDLQSAGEHLGQTGQLGKTKDTTIWDVSNMHLRN